MGLSLSDYLSSYNLRTVVIEPFVPELFKQESIVNWLQQATAFDIKKSPNGKRYEMMPR